MSLVRTNGTRQLGKYLIPGNSQTSPKTWLNQRNQQKTSPLVPAPPAGLVPPCPLACHVVLAGLPCLLSLTVLGCPRVLYFPSLLAGLSASRWMLTFSADHNREDTHWGPENIVRRGETNLKCNPLLDGHVMSKVKGRNSSDEWSEKVMTLTDPFSPGSPWSPWIEKDMNKCFMSYFCLGLHMYRLVSSSLHIVLLAWTSKSGL